MPVLKLQSKDDMTFEIDLEAAKLSEKLIAMFDLLNDGDYENPIPVSDIDGATLEKVIEWCTHEQNKPVEARFHANMNYKDEKDDWTLQFFQVEQKMVIDLLNAANSLDIKSLIGWASYSVYKMMAGKTPQQIRDTFNITE